MVDSYVYTTKNKREILLRFHGKNGYVNAIMKPSTVHLFYLVIRI